VAVILLVEDDPDTRLMYAEALGGDFDVIQAAAGEEALDVMETRVPDLVITDVSLPGVDGFELVARMRRTEALADVPVICLTGYSGQSPEQRAREAGSDRLLQKPCLPDALAAAASELLERRHDLTGRAHTP
jgi:two-component system CheB/CheR fusion protein